MEISIQNEIKNNKVVDKKHNKYSRVNEDLGELDNSSFSFDNKGRKLTKAQQEYFKNSVVKDEKGNLKVVFMVHHLILINLVMTLLVLMEHL